MVEAVARALEPRAFEVFARGFTVQNYLAQTAFLNAEKNVKRARKKARAAIAAYEAKLKESGMVVVLREPTEAMLRAGFIDTRYDAGYGDRANVYRVMIAAWSANKEQS